MKRLLFLMLIPFVAGAQTPTPRPPGHTVMAAETNAAVYFGGNHTYFVDAVNGHDSYQGYHRSDSAWKSIEKVNASSFSPGDSILFQSGQRWVAQLIPHSSGTAADRILFGGYGTGAKPIISHGDQPFTFTDYGNGVEVTKSYLIFDGLEIDSCRSDGIWFKTSAFGNIVRNCAFNYCGNGVEIDGRSNLVTHNTMTNLWWSIDADSSYSFGSVGVSVLGSANEVSWNEITNAVDLAPLKAAYGGPSWDGCFVELATWTQIQNCDSNYIHHNRGNNVEAFLETGGNGNLNYSLNGNIYAYNAVWGTGHNVGDGGIGLHQDPAETNCGSVVHNLQFYNNTIVFTGHATPANGMMWWYSDNHWDASTFICKNNIFVTDNIPIKSSARSTNFSGSNNLYFRTDGLTTTNVPSNTGATANPLFVNPATSDFHLQPNSPAINAGLNLGYTQDVDGKLLVGAPDIGAYEYGGVAPAPSFPNGSFSASPDTLVTGGVVTLTWTDSNATSASITNGVGPVSIKGGKISVKTDTSVTFILTLTNGVGSRTYKAPITVLSAERLFPSGSFFASPDTLVTGGSVTLTWTDSNATSASITNGVGSVSSKGGKMSVTTDTSVTFILTLTNGVGSRKYTATITVLPPPRGTVSSAGPVEYSLRQNYPNPFNPNTTIQYEVPRATDVTLTVYDLLGRKVSVLVNERAEAGVHKVRFDGSNLASGAYFYMLQAGSFVDSKKLVLLR